MYQYYTGEFGILKDTLLNDIHFYIQFEDSNSGSYTSIGNLRYHYMNNLITKFKLYKF